MKKIIKKTEEEMKEQETFKEVKLRNYNCYFFYFSCDKCELAFFKDDIILESSEGGANCPLCKGSMYGGGKKTFNKYYKLKI